MPGKTQVSVLSLSKTIQIKYQIDFDIAQPDNWKGVLPTESNTF